MGTPRDIIGISQLLRQRARRSAWSPPESQDTFASVPPSEGPNGKGCWLSLSLKLTKSNIVKPSWAVRKLMDFWGPALSLKCSQSPFSRSMKARVLPSPLR